MGDALFRKAEGACLGTSPGGTAWKGAHLTVRKSKLGTNGREHLHGQFSQVPSIKLAGPARPSEGMECMTPASERIPRARRASKGPLLTLRTRLLLFIAGVIA